MTTAKRPFVVPPPAQVMLAAMLLAAGLWALVYNYGQGPTEYPKTARAGFLHACQVVGGAPTTCQCTLKKLEAAYDFVQYKRLEPGVTSARDLNKLPFQVTELLMDCER